MAQIRNLFDPNLTESIKQRIMQLQPESQRQWGSMSVAKTLAHCTSSLELAMGKINPKRASFPASLVGLLIKPLVVGSDQPIRRNVASLPELFSAADTQHDFERERGQLIEAIDRFCKEGAACCSTNPHPFFGAMKPMQWAVLMYKHLDHHLRQFGV